MDTIIAGIIQGEYGVDPAENYEKTRKILLENYAEADIVLLPEYSMINVLGGLKPREVLEKAERIEDSTYLSKLSDLAGKLGTTIIAHFIEKTDKSKPYSTSVVVKPDGSVEKAYSKIHLFDAYGYRESDYLEPGDKPSRPVMVGSFKFYVAICYDIRFPELFRHYALNGADGVLVHMGWVRGPLKEELLNVLARSRSHENTMYLVVANHTGKQYTGRSGLFNPYGYRELDMGVKPGYREVVLDKGVVESARRDIPVLEHSRSRWNISFK